MERIVITVLCVIVGAAWAADNGGLLAFKSCGTPSSIQRCKVKTVKVSGCQEQEKKVAVWNNLPKGENDIEDRKGDRNFCEVNKKTHLNFTITLDASFSSSKLSSQFTVIECPGEDCPSAARRGGQCTPRRRVGKCSPASRTADYCIFREYVRDGCRSTSCPLSKHGPQKVTDYLKVNPDSEVTAVEKGSYKVQWKLWNNPNKKDNCCFTFVLKYY